MEPMPEPSMPREGGKSLEELLLSHKNQPFDRIYDAGKTPGPLMFSWNAARYTIAVDHRTSKECCSSDKPKSLRSRTLISIDRSEPIS